jgi:hypothetical protein
MSAIKSDGDGVRSRIAGGISLSQLYLNDAQIECLLEFVNQVVRRGDDSVTKVNYVLIGSEDLAARESATAMLQALRAEDWASVSSHSAVAGTNNLLLAILLQIKTEGGRSSNHWVALRSPFEPMDWPSIVAAGRLETLPPFEMAKLLQPGDKPKSH